MSQALETTNLDDVDAQLKDADALALMLERELYRGSFYAFIKASWSIVEPEVPLTENWHIDLLTTELQNVELGITLDKRFIFNIPPGTLKSLLINVFFPAWVWTRKPQKRFISFAYGAHLSIRDNLRCRTLIESPWYQRLFPLALIDDQNTKTRYNNEKGGWRIASSVDGVGTGEHPDYIIIDDPLSASGAESEVERAAAIAWYDRTVAPRGVARNVVTLVVMQRLHVEDLSGHMLAKGGVRHICLPMRYMATRAADPARGDQGYTACELDPRTEQGELLCPKVFDEKKVKQLELDLGPYGAAGQLQQQPSPEGGGLFQRGWFKVIDAPPIDAKRWVRGWDTAASEASGDYTVGVKLAMLADQSIIVLDVVRGQWSPDDVEKNMKTTAQVDGKRCLQREEKEGGASGKTVILGRAKLLHGFDYAGVTVSGSKVIRANLFRAQVQAGNVSLVRAPWNEAYLVELSNFPVGKHDDQVDASSAAYNHLILDPPKPKGGTW